MKVGVNLINFGPSANPENLRRWATLSEDLGYHLLMTSDHVAMTPDVQARFPAPFYEPFSTLGWLAGVTRIVESDRRDSVVGFEIESDRGRDIHRDLARAVVTSGWGLLELRPMRISLEQIFLSLTTSEAPTEAPASDARVPAPEEAAHE